MPSKAPQKSTTPSRCQVFRWRMYHSAWDSVINPPDERILPGPPNQTFSYPRNDIPRISVNAQPTHAHFIHAPKLGYSPVFRCSNSQESNAEGSRRCMTMYQREGEKQVVIAVVTVYYRLTWLKILIGPGILKSTSTSTICQSIPLDFSRTRLQMKQYLGCSGRQEGMEYISSWTEPIDPVVRVSNLHSGRSAANAVSVSSTDPLGSRVVIARVGRWLQRYVFREISSLMKRIPSRTLTEHDTRVICRLLRIQGIQISKEKVAYLKIRRGIFSYTP